MALIASLLTAIPFTPAGLGIVELGIVGILTASTTSTQTEAAAIALVDRAISVLSVIVFGGIAYVLSDKTKGTVRHDGDGRASRHAGSARIATMPATAVRAASRTTPDAVGRRRLPGVVTRRR